MKKLFFILIFVISNSLFALPDTPDKKSLPNDYKAGDPNLTSLIFTEIVKNGERPDETNYIFEQYSLAARQIWKSVQTKEEFIKINNKLYADYLNEAYKNSKIYFDGDPSPENQKRLDKDKKDLEAQILKIKTDQKEDYTPQAITDQFATEIDTGKRTYVYKGVTYDEHDNKQGTIAKKKSIDTTLAKNKSADPTVVSTQSGGTTNPAAFASCVWDTANPRKVVYGPSCNGSGSCLCRGYVSCDRGGIKKRRLATCSENNCSDSTASQCSAEKNGFGSDIPQN